MQFKKTLYRTAGLVGISTFLCFSVLAAPAMKDVSASKEPIEINADDLEIFQEENKAIFTGRVVAIQGDMRLKSDKMTVYYRSPEKKEESGAKKEDQQPQQDAIKKIEVEGNVFMTTPEETARGKRGVYSVEKEQLVLTQDVVLTRGKNTLKGNKLTYDMKKGRSVISTGGAGKNKAGKTGRVRALFIPENTKKKEK